MTTYIHTYIRNSTVQEYSFRQASATCKAYLRINVYVVQSRQTWNFQHSPNDTVIFFLLCVCVCVYVCVCARARLCVRGHTGQAEVNSICAIRICRPLWQRQGRHVLFCSIQTHFLFSSYGASSCRSSKTKQILSFVYDCSQDNSTLHIFQFIFIGRPNQAVTDNGPVSVKRSA